MNIDSLIVFLGWCTLLNFGILVFAALFIWLFGDLTRGIYMKMFGISDEQLSILYVRYLAFYKVAIMVFNLVPYLVLQIIS